MKRILSITKWIFFGALVGLLAGLSSTAFLYLLDGVTKLRIAHSQFIWFLPFAGAAVGLLYHQYGKEVERGHALILDEIHDPKKIIPLKMAPLIFLGTLITHLFGGSAGREGTAVQIGASLSDQITKFFKIPNRDRKILLVAGMGAGFGSALGAPFAGFVFGMEVVYINGLKPVAVLECLVASFVGYYTSILLRAPHSKFPEIFIPWFDFKIWGAVFIAGIIFGLSAYIFIKLTHMIEHLYRRLKIRTWMRPLLGGVLLVVLYGLVRTDIYSGLGISTIQEALKNPALIRMPFLKILFTSVTLGSGFKGGEFIPLVFIGTTLGSSLSFWLPASAPLLGALGFPAVFAGASKTPVACAIMATEIFGLAIAPYALVVCWISVLFSGPKGIYKRSI